MANKKILVIGGTGYIGKVLVDKLLQNYTVKGVGSKECDVLDKYNLSKVIKEYDLIIYLAAVIRTKDKSKYYDNITGLYNTIQAMKKNNINKILYVSTQAIHKKTRGLYASSKSLAEYILKHLSKDLNFEYIIVRPNYVYGIDKQNDIWKLYNIAKWIKLCPVIGHGDNRIQPIRKEVLCDKIIKIIDNWKSKVEIDISGDMTVSLNEIASIISKRTKSKLIHIPISILNFIKRFIKFDLEGYEEDMLAGKNSIRINTYIENDIERIGELK